MLFIPVCVYVKRVLLFNANVGVWLINMTITLSIFCLLVHSGFCYHDARITL